VKQLEIIWFCCMLLLFRCRCNSNGIKFRRGWCCT